MALGNYPSLTLLTDLYQLTMAYGYWKEKRYSRRAVFHLFYRNNPFQGGFTVTAGLQHVLDYVTNFRFTADDLDYLATIAGNDNRPIFDPAFLHYLSELRLEVDIDAMPEGTVAFPHEPLLRIQGPILHCQLLETALLNMVNFQTLIATKAARIVRAAKGDSVLEFGLRRAQGIDGSLAASRAAYIGGCHATSNVLAGKIYGIPVKGTHAHSWVMSFDTELAAFDSYADAMPNNCVFLVDTYDTLEGIRNAIQVAQKLKKHNHRLVGIRLDSGDLAYLSIEARRLLDEAGLQDAAIVASNDLDERLIESLKQQGAKISIWGVGTKLITAYDQPALGGVYKLGAMLDENGQWKPKIKLSEQLIKTSTPGMLQVRRFYHSGKATADMIFSQLQPLDKHPVMVDPLDSTRRNRHLTSEFEDLLQPVTRNGQSVSPEVPLSEVRKRSIQQLEHFHETILRFDHPHQYPVGLEQSLHELKTQMMIDLRETTRQ